MKNIRSAHVGAARISARILVALAPVFGFPEAARADVGGVASFAAAITIEPLAAYGGCFPGAAYVPAADFDGNGCTDLSDLGISLAAFGT